MLQKSEVHKQKRKEYSMKNPKKLTRTQKERLTKKHLDAKEFVMIEEDAFTYTVQKKNKIGTNEDKYTFDK